jgi:transposase InsO family protein
MLRDHGIEISMDGRGRCHDNIFVERLWWTVKHEWVYLRPAANGISPRIARSAEESEVGVRGAPRVPGTDSSLTHRWRCVRMLAGIGWAGTYMPGSGRSSALGSLLTRRWREQDSNRESLLQPRHECVQAPPVGCDVNLLCAARALAIVVYRTSRKCRGRYSRGAMVKTVSN